MPNPNLQQFDRMFDQIVEALEKCSSIKDDRTRDQIIGRLPPNISKSILRSQIFHTDVTSIFQKCLEYQSGVETFLKLLGGYETNSIAYLNVVSLWEQITAPTTSSGPLPPTPEVTIKNIDEDVKLAQELHWDRDIIVKTFLGMVKGDPKYTPWRILALEGPKEAGLNTLVRRLEYICEQLAMRSDMKHPLLHARIKFQPFLSSAPHSVAKEIVSSLAKNADLCMAEMEGLQLQALPQLSAVYSDVRQKLDETRNKVDKNWGSSTEDRKPQSKTELANDLNECLKLSSQNCTIVLLFEDFDQLDTQCHSWFLDDWLGRYIVSLEKVVVVIVGMSGLKQLEGRDRFTHYRPNVPTMTLADLLEWANRGWGLTDITEQEVEDANEDCKGDPVKYLTYLRAWAIHKHLPIPDVAKKKAI